MKLIHQLHIIIHSPSHAQNALTLTVLGFAAPLDLATCILVFTRSKGCNKYHNIIWEANILCQCYLYKECGAHAWEAAEEEFDSIGDCFGLGHTASENGVKIISVSEYPERTFANEVISRSHSPKYSWMLNQNILGRQTKIFLDQSRGVFSTENQTAAFPLVAWICLF